MLFYQISAIFTADIQYISRIKKRESLPYCLDVLPAGNTSHGSFLVFGSAMHCQKLRGDLMESNLGPETALMMEFTDK